MADKMTLEQARDWLRENPPQYESSDPGVMAVIAAIDAHLAQPAQAVDVGLAERLRKRAGEERTIAANNARVAELPAPELVRFDAREGHNIYATRMAIDHRDSAKRDAAFADDLEAAATALTRAIGNAQADDRTALQSRLAAADALLQVTQYQWPNLNEALHNAINVYLQGVSNETCKN